MAGSKAIILDRLYNPCVSKAATIPAARMFRKVQRPVFLYGLIKENDIPHDDNKYAKIPISEATGDGGKIMHSLRYDGLVHSCMLEYPVADTNTCGDNLIAARA